MNKPIRRVAFIAMIMFALLLANGTHHDDLPAVLAGRPATERGWDAEFAQNRGAILAAGKHRILGTVPAKALQIPAGHYRTARLPVRRSPASIPRPTTSSGLERTYNAQLAGTDDALFVRRLVDMATNRTPEGTDDANHDRSQDSKGCC